MQIMCCEKMFFFFVAISYFLDDWFISCCLNSLNLLLMVWNLKKFQFLFTMYLMVIDIYCIYWSGIHVRDEQQKNDSHNKKVMVFVVASTALGAVILSLLSFWIYYTKYCSKSNKKNLQSSGIFPWIFNFFHWETFI